MPNMIRKLKSYVRRSAAIFVVCAFILSLASTALAQWNEQVLYSFQGLPDGATPIGGLVTDKRGNIYGATAEGGASSCAGPAQCGTVFELTPPGKNGDPWTETLLHVFKGRASGDGASPGGGLVIDAAGNLYGVTSYDGMGDCKVLGGVVGCGTVYEISPSAQPGGSWTETVLYNFQGGMDGYLPGGDLVFDKTGNLYGATVFGGGKGTNCGDSLYPNCGTIFELSPPKQKGGPWTEKVLYSFEGMGNWSIAGDGAEPNGDLVFDEQGNIYGTALFGGSSSGSCRFYTGCGTLFELVPPRKQGGAWTEKILHSFQGQPNDGARPNGNLVLANGVIYGATGGGGTYEEGTIFDLQPSANGNGAWTENLIHVFTEGSDGAGPSSLILTPDGTFYGTAGGGPSRGGLIFQLQPPAHEGAAWNFGVEYNFTGTPNGYDPQDLTLLKGRDEMYGSTFLGGTGPCLGGGCGTVFAVKP